MDLVLITGATDGIGLELVKYYLEKESRVIATGRRAKSELPSDFPADAIYVQADQTDLRNIDGIVSVVAEQVNPALSCVILNAGTGFSSDLMAENPDEIDATLAANLDFNIMLTHALFPHLHMIKDGMRYMGKVALIGSVAYKGAAKFPTYAATKAGLHGFARALREEWFKRVVVQIIHPGPTRTNMHGKANFDVSKMERWFLKPDWMARNIAIVISQGRPRAKLSYGTWIMSRLHWLDGPVRHFRKVPR